MAEAPDAAANLFVEQVRKLVRVLRYGSREAVLALVGFLLFGAARWLKELKELPPEIPKQVQTWTSVSLYAAGGLCFLLAARQIWRKVTAPLPAGGEPRLPALKGAASFGPKDADLFARLGRDAELERLRDWILDDQRPLVVLMGESGIGKTSLLRAGLAHVLEKDGLLVIYWEAMPAEPEASLLHTVRSDWGSTEGLPDSFPALATAVASSPHVVVIDQLEQLSPEEHAAMFGLLREILLENPPYKSTWIVAFRRKDAATWFDFELTLPEHALARVREKLSIHRFKPSDARRVVAVLAEEAGLPIEHRVVGELIDGITDAGGVSPVDIGITLLGLGELTGEDGRVSFSLENFRVSGGQTGLLTRYLERVLSQLADAEKNEVLLALLSLADFEKDLRVAKGRELTALEKTAKPVSPGRFAAALKYLASTARVLENVAAPSAEPRYRLIHERLISAVEVLNGVLLAEAQKAGRLFEKAYREWSREKRRKYLLAGRDLRQVVRSLGQFPWGDEETGKREFLRKSTRQRWIARALVAGACAALLGLGSWLRISLEKKGVESELAAWRLPIDLGERLDQLEELDLSGITSVEWLGKATKLRTLTIHKSQLKTLDGLPAGIQSLSITDSETRDVKNWPKSLQVLDLATTPSPSLSTLPRNLRSLTLSDSQLSSLSGLPPTLQSLTLYAGGLSSLSGLPPTLQSLTLYADGLSSLSGLPPTLQSLTLYEDHLSSLSGLPSTLRSLTLYEYNLSGFSSVPLTLQALALSGVGLYRLPNLPSTLQSLAIYSPDLPSLAGLPPTLQSLTLSHTMVTFGPSGRVFAVSPSTFRSFTFPSLPPMLQALSLSDIQLSSLSDLPPKLQSLSLSDAFDFQISSLTELPPTLRSLNISIANPSSLTGLPPSLRSLAFYAADLSSLPSLSGLPPNLRTLDLSYANLPNLLGLPASLQSLNLAHAHASRLTGLPPNLKSLNVAGTGIRSLEGLPPNLEELSLNRSQVETLKGLPQSVRVLRFIE